jgi:acetyl esterase/lipase
MLNKIMLLSFIFIRYPQWALDLCTLHSAVIVTPDYRLLPESKGIEMFSDICSFWDWVRTGLQPYLNTARPGLVADLSKIFVHGESAGGAIALLSGFSQPKDFIKAIVSMYPVIDLSPKRTKPILGAPTIPVEVLQTHLNSMLVLLSY